MIDIFKNDFYWMLRERKGYFSWIKDNPDKLARHLLNYNRRRCPMCEDRILNSREIVRAITEKNVCENPLFDILMKALIRAEVRLMSRFIPQRSHEERLTGNLVSEIDNAIFLVREIFKKTCLSLYKIEKVIDFFYYDLSQGGKLEKETGADLGLILVIDLPDFPYTVKSFILQAKKISGNSVQIDREQYETMMKHRKSECAYLFYDMNLARLCSPLIVKIDHFFLENQYKESEEDNTASFNIKFDDVNTMGHPLSLFVISHLIYGESIGASHSSFESAFSMFYNIWDPDPPNNNSGIKDFNGRLAIISLGRSIKYSVPHNEGLHIEV